MWRKNISSDKTWAEFNNFSAREYHNPHKLQHINATQASFHGANTTITMKDEISEASENLSMTINSEKYVITQLTITIKQLAKTNKIKREKIKTPMAINARLIENVRHQKIRRISRNRKWP